MMSITEALLGVLQENGFESFYDDNAKCIVINQNYWLFYLAESNHLALTSSQSPYELWRGNLADPDVLSTLYEIIRLNNTAIPYLGK